MLVTGSSTHIVGSKTSPTAFVIAINVPLRFREFSSPKCPRTHLEAAYPALVLGHPVPLQF